MTNLKVILDVGVTMTPLFVCGGGGGVVVFLLLFFFVVFLKTLSILDNRPLHRIPLT